MESKQYATAEGARAEEFRDWTAPLSGRLYRLRKVWPVDLIKDGIFSIEEAGRLEEIRAKIAADEPLDQFEQAIADLFKRAILCRGIANPDLKVVDLSPAECREGELSVHEFPRDDYDFAILAISEWSGFNRALSDDQESVVNAQPIEGDRFRPEGNGGSQESPSVSEEAAGSAH